MFLSYASSSKNLSVIFCTDELYVNTTPQSLFYKVNLTNYLPKFITSGSSSATRDLYEINVIYSWNFSSSNLQISDSAEENQGKKTGLVVVGLSVGVCALVAGLGLVCFFLWKKKINEKGVKDHDFDLSKVDDFAKGTLQRQRSLEREGLVGFIKVSCGIRAPTLLLRGSQEGLNKG